MKKCPNCGCEIPEHNDYCSLACYENVKKKNEEIVE